MRPLLAVMAADGKGLPARAGAEIDDDFAALRAEQQGDELAAFVLHFERAVEEAGMFAEGGFVVQADAPR